MESRYLYRGKRSDNGEWVEWNMLTGIPHDVHILKDTICQCIGRTDKSGELIWENDIVNVLCIGPVIGMKEKQIREGANGKIVYYEGTYWVENNGKMAMLLLYEGKEIKRLGSILDVGEEKARKLYDVVSCFQNGNS